MEADPWASRLSALSERLQSQSGIEEVLMELEEMETNDGTREQFRCPFCSECCDIVGLCCHIDEDHSGDAQNGICPICAVRVDVDMVAHITLQHGNVFKVQRKTKSSKSGSHSVISSLIKELRDGNLDSFFGGSSCTVSSSNAAPDPLLSSFISPMAVDILSSDSNSSPEITSAKKDKDHNTVERGRNVRLPPLSIKDQEERNRRAAFVHRLLFSTMFEDTF